MSTSPRCAEAYIPWCQMKNRSRFETFQRKAAEAKAAEAKAAKAKAAETEGAETAVITGPLIDLDSSIHVDVGGLDLSKFEPEKSRWLKDLELVFAPPAKTMKYDGTKDLEALPSETLNVLLDVYEEMEELVSKPQQRKMFLNHLKILIDAEKLD